MQRIFALFHEPSDIVAHGASVVLEDKTLTGDHDSVSFEVPQASGWLALIVEDNEGRKAYTNPIWLELVDESQF